MLLKIEVDAEDVAEGVVEVDVGGVAFSTAGLLTDIPICFFTSAKAGAPFFWSFWAEISFEGAFALFPVTPISSTNFRIVALFTILAVADATVSAGLGLLVDLDVAAKVVPTFLGNCPVKRTKHHMIGSSVMLGRSRNANEPSF